MSSNNNISGKVVVITGASSGIGEAIARHLAEKGALVVLGARRTDRLQQISNEITANGGQASFLAVDVTKPEEVKDLVQLAIRSYGRLDVLVNNAGVMPLSFLNNYKIEEWHRMVDVNIKGVLHGIAAALPVFEKNQSGQFINISSVGDRWVGPTSVVYSATKFAVRAISDGLRQEAGPNIRVTLIAPGATESELAESISDPGLKKLAIEQFRKDLLNADAIARAAAFAISQPAEVDVNELVLRPTSQKNI
ncbi:MAG: SDR family oxidoreductase [Chitinophagaceae bacterium]|nr:SDR family oxidoreductase [Chitinophagaceae bacterium]